MSKIPFYDMMVKILGGEPMKRALWFLIAALIMALIVQPNLSTVHEPEVRTPTNTTSSAKTNDTIDMGISHSKATICLDAGGGGIDTGYTSGDHTPEKDINLQIVQKIGNYLTQAEYNVVYTRTDDSTIVSANEVDSSKQRIQLAKDQNAQYLISIHMSDDVDTTIQGYSLFTHPKEDLIDLCNAINEKLMSINYSRFNGLDSDHYENFPILMDQSLSTIMIELGYLSNTEDYTNLTNEDYQDRIAHSICEAILAQID